MRAAGFVGLGLVAYSVGLVAFVPAGYVASQVVQRVRGVEISNAQGSMWRGSAHLHLFPARGGPELERVEWRLAPLRLFAGELAFNVQASAPQFRAQADAARTLSQWLVRDLKAEGDAAALAAFVPALAPLRPSGPFTLSASSLAFAQRELTGSLEGEWREAASALTPVKPLGTYRATWTAQVGPGKIAVTTVDGALRIEGQGTTSAGPRLAFSGEARAQGPDAKALEPLLDLIGPRRPDGARAIELRLE